MPSVSYAHGYNAGLAAATRSGGRVGGMTSPVSRLSMAALASLARFVQTRPRGRDRYRAWTQPAPRPPAPAVPDRWIGGDGFASHRNHLLHIVRLGIQIHGLHVEGPRNSLSGYLAKASAAASHCAGIGLGRGILIGLHILPGSWPASMRCPAARGLGRRASAGLAAGSRAGCFAAACSGAGAWARGWIGLGARQASGQQTPPLR